jgi:hypothetical protein
MDGRGDDYEYCCFNLDALSRAVKSAKKSNDLKEAVKAALIEVLHERQDLLREALTEALEDIGMIHAIDEGLKSEPATRKQVFAALRRTG